jgi:hypothetical protein
VGGTGGWMDGLGEDDDILDDQAVDAPPPPPAAKPPADVLTCRHCASDRITPRSSSGDTIAVKFCCAVCGKFSTYQLEYGYRKVYRAIRDDA